MNIINYNDNIVCNLGGKANSLFKLINLGYNVPKFFVITNNAFINFIEENKLSNIIKTFANKNQFDEIKKLIKNCKINQKAIDEIYKMFKKNAFSIVSVRSSANNEDGKRKSFAGQYESFLNINQDNLIENIKNCWISVFNQNVFAYNNLNSDNYGMNVIIQEMIDADYSGVCFSVDPTSQNKSYMLIESCKGLGENLVSGTITPTSYFIRKETSYIDLIEGQNIIDEKIIMELYQTATILEKEYSNYVDIEWCIKNDKLYLLQCRPITAFNKNKKRYVKCITRPYSMFEIEIYDQGERKIKQATNGLYTFNPLFIYISKKDTFEVYYNYFDLEEDPKCMANYLEKNYEYYQDNYKKIINKCQKVKKIISDKKFNNYPKLKNLIIDLYTYTTLCNVLSNHSDIAPRVAKDSIYFRDTYDKLIYDSFEIIKNRMLELLPISYRKNITYLKFNEVFNNKLPTLNEIKLRKKDFVRYKDKEYYKNINSVLSKNNIYIIKDEDKEDTITGDVAYSGKVMGKVKLVFNNKDTLDFHKGDIIVSPMTTPKITSIIKKAVGIITDEGGLTCHAAIIAREMKIPCIIGCKNATEKLMDGMIVELDANSGKITIV